MRKTITVAAAVAATVTLASPAGAADRNDVQPQPGDVIVLDLGHTDIHGNPDGVPDAILRPVPGGWTAEPSQEFRKVAGDDLSAAPWERWRTGGTTAGTDVTVYSSEEPTVRGEFHRPGKGKSMKGKANVKVTADPSTSTYAGPGAPYRVVKFNPRTGGQWVDSKGRVSPGEVVRTMVHFPSSRKTMQVRVISRGEVVARTPVAPAV